MNDKQAEQIAEVMKLRQTALASILAGAMKDMSVLAAGEMLAQLKRGKYTISTFEGITDALIAEYTANIAAGGSMCIERVLEETDGGMLRATTERRFVPWLSDMTKSDTKNIISLIADAEQAGVHPRNTAKQLEEYFDGTRHNAMTAARTEASKIRNDSRSAAMTANGVHYVQYITAGDELVRPEHELRNGKIYRHEDAPWIGEYNCRCTLAPADYLVEVNGAEVAESQAEYLTPEEAGISTEK